MGIMVGRSREVIQIKKSDGSVAATVSVSRPRQKKTKRLNYNFKSISSQIMLSKTSEIASKAVTKARGTLASLLRKMGSGDYDDKEIEMAVIHARKMERVARKRVKHLKQEEDIKEKGHSAETNELVKDDEKEQGEKELEVSEEEMQKLMEEYEKLMREAMQEQAEEAAAEEMEEDFAEAVYEMRPEDFERLKKKHRSDEMREIMDADMKYLRAMFSKLEKERQALSNGTGSLSGVSLEISGLELPVGMPDMPAMAEGGNVDLAL